MPYLFKKFFSYSFPPNIVHLELPDPPVFSQALEVYLLLLSLKILVATFFQIGPTQINFCRFLSRDTFLLNRNLFLSKYENILVPLALCMSGKIWMCHLSS